MKQLSSPSKVGLGTVYLMAAQGTLLVSGYLMHILLGRYLGPAEYGLFGVALYAANMIRTLIGGLPMAVARYVAAESKRSERIFQKGLLLQSGLGAFISLMFFFIAPSVARLLGDENLTPLFRLVAPIPLLYGVFFLIIQYYNGLRRYIHQSAWLIVYYVLRAVLAIFLTLAGMRVFGAITGLVAASGIVGLLTIISRIPGENKETFPALCLIRFSAPLIIGSVSLALLMDLDLMFVKKLVPDNASAGHYTSAKALAQAALFMFYAFSSALYPAVSNAYSKGDMTGLKQYIQQANRVLLMVLLPLMIVVYLDSTEIISLFFGGEYVEAAPILQWLIVSFSALAGFIVHKTVITGCGFPTISSSLPLLILPLCIGLHLTLIPVFGVVGAAMASTLTYMIGGCCSLAILYIKFKAGFHRTSTLRIVVAALLLLLSDIALTRMGLNFILKIPFLAAFYPTALVLLGELNRTQVDYLWSIFKK